MSGGSGSFPYEFNGWMGLPTVLTHERWDHIRTRHPELEGKIAAVIATVQNPSLVTRDKNHQKRLCFYRDSSEVSISMGSHVKVCVELDDEIPAMIITAFVARNVRSGERILWKRP